MRQFKPPYKKRIRSKTDYDHSKTLGAGPLVFPHELLSVSRILTQNGQKCTAYSAVEERGPVVGVNLDPEGQWKLELQYSGTSDSNGFDLKTKLATGIKIGFIPEGKDLPDYKASAYFFVFKNSGMDWFDAVRSAVLQLYQKYGKVIPLSIGVNWFDEWDNPPNGIIPDSAINLLGGHDVKIAGFETYNVDGNDYIVLQNSWGPNFGDGGLYRVSRSVFNKHFEGFGCGYWVDDPNVAHTETGLLNSLIDSLTYFINTLRNFVNKTGVKVAAALGFPKE